MPAGNGRLRFGPESQHALQRGIALLEQTLGPTLGPCGRPVAVARIGRPNQSPELLDDGATIARRIIGLPERFPNMGLMLARHVAWRMQTGTGDGAATAVVLLAAAHRELCRYIAAGADPHALRRGVERAVEAAAGMLTAAAMPLDRAEAQRYATAIAGDTAVARVVSDAMAILGVEMVIVARESTGSGVTLDCIEGALWESSSVMAPLANDDGGREMRLDRPAVLPWDAALDDPQLLASALGRLRADGISALLLVARSYSPAALALIRRNNTPPFVVAPVIVPHEGAQQAAALADLAVLSGTRVLSPECGDSLEKLTAAAVGCVRRVTVGPRYMNVLASDVDRSGLARHVAAIRQQMDEIDDDKEWRRQLLRVGRLEQGMGVIWVGAPTPAERSHRLHVAEKALGGLRGALTGGTLPGGGASFLGVARRLTPAGRSDEDLGVLAVVKALEAPAWWIARNAGLDPSWAVQRGAIEAPDRGIDGIGGKLRDLRAAGIVDAATTLIHALRIGLTMAATVCTCDVLVHRPISLAQAELRP